MRQLRWNLGIWLVVRGVCHQRPWLERLGVRVCPSGPAWRCPACHGTGYAWDASIGTMGPCDCLLN